ncbi:MAG: GYD domain-containing protein [Acidimicrobiales bacterium]
MAKFLFKVRYTGEGLEGVVKAGGSERRAAADDLAKELGGAVESFHFAFGEDDAYVICDLPDNKAAATLAMTVSATGRVSLTTVPLLTVDEVDAIAAGRKPAYSPPGA